MVSSDGFDVWLVLLLLVVMVTGTLGCVAGRYGVRQCRWLCCCLVLLVVLLAVLFGGAVGGVVGGDDVLVPSY